MIRCRCLFVILVLLCTSGTAAAERESLSIIAPAALLADPVAQSAVDDTLALLRRAFPAARVACNDPTARVRLVLELARPARQPGEAYRWRSTPAAGGIVLRATVRSPRGAAAALYGLLQEQLGFRFYHPRRTIIPAYRRWPLPARFSWQAVPRFASRGFHLHTLHPIELAGPLNDPDSPGALAAVEEYLDWLARNGQNTLQFYLLRGVDRARWPAHARAIVAYAHRRGVRVGVEVSFCMLQQQAFQLFKPLRPVPYRRQVDRNLAWLFQVPWDFVTVEPALGEYLPDLAGVFSGLKRYLIGEITGRYRTRLLLATHVIRNRQERAVEAVGSPLPLAPEERQCGVLIHTVMCYSATEANAPVYGNVNQRFMMARARQESRRRETWYWPESAYWVAFDNSVPLLLLPYLEARWSDMASMERAGVTGHLTFSSGWEWGYWLTDWSIARWSWRYRLDGRPVPDGPLSVLDDLVPERWQQARWRQALRLQDRYLKGAELLRYLPALAPFSELPPPFDEPFQPEPPFSFGWLLHDASDRQAAAILQGPVARLEEYATALGALVDRLEEFERETPRAPGRAAGEAQALRRELLRGLQVTALRARHRALTLRALVAQRAAPHWWQPTAAAAAHYLARAAAVREEAQRLVREQEAVYRYPVDLIARRRPDLTAYDFGYLYPVSELFFWQREEEQVRRRRFDAFFMKLWNFRKTLGLESLLF